MSKTLQLKLYGFFQMISYFPGSLKIVRLFQIIMRGKHALFMLVVRNGFTRFVWEVFVREKFLYRKFWVFEPLHSGNHQFQEEHVFEGARLTKP